MVQAHHLQDTGGIQPKNSGSLGSPITFKAYPQHKPIIDQNFESMGFFIQGKNYITIDGLEIRNIWWAGIRTESDSNNLQGLVIQNNKIHDINGPTTENVGAIRPDNAVGAVIRNNYLYNVYGPKATGIVSYRLRESIVENNEIWNAQVGIGYKAQYITGNITRYNYIHDTSNVGLWFNSTVGDTPSCSNHTVHNNIIYKANKAISMWECDDGVSQNNKFYNNTIVDTIAGFYMVAGGTTNIETTQIWNNIIYNTVDGGSQWDTVIMMVDKPSFISLSNYNNFYETTQWLPISWNKSNYTFSGYQSASGFDVNSMSVDPLFVDKTNQNFHLQSNSPLKGKGLGGVDIGAYATGNEIIGPTDGGTGGGGGGNTGGNTGGGGDSSSGGSGCGFVKDNNGKGEGAKGEGVALIIMLIITLAGISLARRSKSITATKEGVLVMEIRKNSLIKIAAISFLLTIFWSASAYAQPNITSFSGSLTNKGALTITGSGFGTKATLSPWRWDPIEGISVYSGLSDGDTIPYGATSDTSAYWNENNEGKMKYNTTLSEQRGVSTANVASIGTTNCPTNEDNKKLGTTIPESREKYLTFWIWYDTTFTNENSKVMRLWEGNTGATRFSYVLSWANNNGGTVYKTENGSEPWHVNLPTFTRPVAGEWMRVEVYIKQESIPVTSNDGEVWVTQFIDHTNGTSTKHEYLSGSGQNIDGILPERIRWLTFGFDKNCWEPAPYKNINIRMDDIYIDLTRARVEIGNGSTWASTTHREIQIPSAWSNTSITITLNQGSLANFNNAYLYVIDADGNVNTNGYLLSEVGGGGDTGGNTAGGDASASGGSGCGFVKDNNGKGQEAKGEGLLFMIMLIILLAGIAIAKRVGRFC